ncbi:MAG: hypothetical protein IPO36_10860 [Anaerolineales bacterium]|nr:hypothetical protein [Anaerolineales bacterium]
MSKRNRMFLAIVSSVMLVAVALGLWGRLGPMSTQVSQALASNAQHVETDEKMGDHPDEARQFRALSMMDENGNIPADGLFTAAQQMSDMRLQQGEQSAGDHQRWLDMDRPRKYRWPRAFHHYSPR